MIALYPGAFKPPHRGHFEVVKGLLKNTHGGSVYTKDTGVDIGTKALAGEKGKVEKIEKVIIFTGGGERNGITKEESTAIWKIYSKYLPGLEILDGQKNPMFAAKDYAKENNNLSFYAVTGVRGAEDFSDLNRITTFKNTPNVQGLVVPPPKGAEIRATDLRKAALEGNLDDLRDFFPKELNRQELLTILKMLKDNVIAEIMNHKMENLFEAMFTSEEKTIVKEVEKETKPELTEYIASVLEYMLDQGMKIIPLPEIKTRHDEAEASNFFGRTAYYDPNKNEIVLYTAGRHQKDIVRSFVHEMVHHMQNLEGRLGQIGTSNTNEDDHLLEIEKEAYLTGNITFRNWEDSVKNSSKKKVMAEGRYDKISNQISSDLFKSFKKGDESFYDNYYSDDLDFDVYGTFVPTDKEKYFSVDGDADYDETGEGNDSIQFILSYNPSVIPAAYEEIAFTIKDVVRHEIEHLTHSDSDNLKPGKYMEDDSMIRALIKLDKLPKGNYFKLEKEIDANIQGMYFRAKKEKRPFKDVVKQYFDDQNLPEKEYSEIINLMKKRLPALGIKQRL